MFSLICVSINGWENNLEAGDLSRYRAHYDVIVMMFVATQQYDDNGAAEKQAIRAWISNYIPQYIVGCNYLPTSKIPVCFQTGYHSSHASDEGMLDVTVLSEMNSNQLVCPVLRPSSAVAERTITFDRAFDRY